MTVPKAAPATQPVKEYRFYASEVCEGESDFSAFQDYQAEQASIAREWFPTAFDDVPF